MYGEITTISREQFEQIEELVGLSEVTPRSYSGRGMYGAECFGIDAPDMRQVAKFLVGLAVVLGGEDDIEESTEFAAKLQTDSMGYGIIAYFPGVEWQDDEDEAFGPY